MKNKNELNKEDMTILHDYFDETKLLEFNQWFQRLSPEIIEDIIKSKDQVDLDIEESKITDFIGGDYKLMLGR